MDTTRTSAWRQGFPVVIAVTLVIGLALSQLQEALSVPYSYPKGPAALFYNAALIGGAVWIVVCFLLLAIDSWREQSQKARPTADLWDFDLDGAFAEPGFETGSTPWDAEH